jgi:flagellar hook-length control protein FliK
MPKLKQMLEKEGFTLADSHVGDQGANEQGAQEQESDNGGSASYTAEKSELPRPAITVASNRLVDHYV